MTILKKIIRKIINATHYDIHKIVETYSLDKALYYRLYDKESIVNKRFYNIGAGGFRHFVWTNVDHPNDWFAEVQGDDIDIKWDMLSLTSMPIENNTAEIVYSSHAIEHVTDEAVRNMLSESYRVLKKGATLRLTMPNIDLDYRAYKDNDRDYFSWLFKEKDPKSYMLTTTFSKASIQQIFLCRFATNASTLHADGASERISDEELDRCFKNMKYEEALNYCISKVSIKNQKKYPGGHINWFNKNKIFKMLRNSGFKDIYLSGYGQSFSPVLRNTIIFDTTVPKVSLYVEAIK